MKFTSIVTPLYWQQKAVNQWKWYYNSVLSNLSIYKLSVVFMLPFIIGSGFCIDIQAQSKPETQGVEKGFAGKKFIHIPRVENNFRDGDCSLSPFRTIDGTCNNISDPEKCDWGASDIMLHRLMDCYYGPDDTLNSMNGQDRKSPREISNIVSDQTVSTPSSRNLSSLVFSWGQFLDHDIDLTPEGETEISTIPIPSNDPLFTDMIPFSRSEFLEGTGDTTTREQMNIITSWIDASNVYGSEQTRADWLRTFEDGKLKTSAGNLLPYNTIDGEAGSALDPTAPSMAGDMEGTVELFVAGDVRANEQSGLTSLHTLFVREHNRLCDELVAAGFTDDEGIYQRARKVVGALMQKITFEDFLPAMGVELDSYVTYQDNIRPDIANLFSAAAYRLGHTMVVDAVPLVDSQCNPVGAGELSLLDMFFDPSQVATYGIDPILMGLASQTQEEVDLEVIPNLRNFLFGNPNNSDVVFGLDLVSLNIQRGRDHGLPDYNTIRAFYTGTPATSFNDISSDPIVQLALGDAYDSDINNIDAWVGLLAEDHLPNSSVGPTLHNILKYQFQSLRDGDRYYYGFDIFMATDMTEYDLAYIENTTLADILERNTELENLPSNIFYATTCKNVTVDAKIMLQGPMMNMPGTLMRDDLRTAAVLPGVEPYTDLGFTHVGGGGEVVQPLVFSVQGDDAIIDWVMLELRDFDDPSIVTETRSALLQRDGDIVDMDGTSAVRFTSEVAKYYVAVRHRNHLGVMTAAAIDFIEGLPITIDYTSPTFVPWGVNAQIIMPDGQQALWAGNSNLNNQLVFQGENNDINTCFFDVMTDPLNTSLATNFISATYNSGDCNMDCNTIYQGTNNDIDIIFFNVLTHPNNTIPVVNFIHTEQLP